MQAAPAAAHEDDGQGPGGYGPSGPITRADLPSGIRDRVSDEALDLAVSSGLAEARAGWDSEIDFVGQLDYQLRFRGQTDYLSTEPAHLGALLVDRPLNVGIELYGLYLTGDEAKELERRQVLGDRIEDVVAALGESEPLVEGEMPRYGPNFAGVWMDQKNGGVIVVALVDPSLVDQRQLEQLVGGREHLRVIDVDHAWNEVEAFRDALIEAIRAGGVQAGVRINSTSQGRKLEVILPNPDSITSDILRVVPGDLVSVSEGPLDVEEGDATSTHVEAEQQPGLQIEFDPGGNCTWGANGHTSSYNYLITAGHCGGSAFENFNGWTNGLEIHQNNSFHLTPGSQYLYSRFTGGWDMKRMSSPQADSNCYHLTGSYHGSGSCVRNVRWRALHNSWEVGADVVCATLGTTNAYECGFVLEENYSSTGCEGSRWVRYDIDTGPGDSGSGLIGVDRSPDVTIDAIHACGSGTTGFGNTAYDVKNRLGFDFNCASSPVTGRSASNWGSCPTYNR